MSPRFTKSSKILSIVFIISLIWLLTYLYSTNFDLTASDPSNIPSISHPKLNLKKSHKENRSDKQLSLNGIVRNLGKDNQKVLIDAEIQEIYKEITLHNTEQKIHNQDKFGPLTDKDPFSCVLVIQVHNRTEYLSLLVKSLSRVPGIEKCLLIFSHDLFIPRLNQVIRTSIDFTRFMQIFYPSSIQLNPNRFPGQSPADCPRDLYLAKARSINCLNSQHPDIHGHYREAKFTQAKHHWLWKADFVFEKINVLRNYTRVITFLEEDHYVLPDFLWMLNLLETSMVSNTCYGCNLIALGTYIKPWNIRTAHSKASVTSWVSNEHNMGMGYNRTIWNELKKCVPTFCSYDDYNWDWSLLHVSVSCLERPLEVAYAEAPRIFHIGDCGLHHKRAKCDPVSAARAIDIEVKNQTELLFPPNLRVEVRQGKKIRLERGNGGWGDVRDHHLCRSFVTN